MTFQVSLKDCRYCISNIDRVIRVEIPLDAYIEEELDLKEDWKVTDVTLVVEADE